MSKLNLSPLEVGLVILGLVAWLIAGVVYGSSEEYKLVGDINSKPAAVAVAPNAKAGLGALGFAVAGGLCMVAVALAHRTEAEREADIDRARAEAEADRAELIHEQAAKIRALEAELSQAHAELFDARASGRAEPS
jgi:hypothetical protein